jgi:[ribosomal protein S18]-alanine N-acetyltransferase
MAASSWNIRGFRPEDFEPLYQIDQICFPNSIAFSRKELTYHLNHPQCITRIATSANAILGFVLARIESSIHAHVLTLDVVPECRKQKIGTSLMKALHEELQRKGISASVLEVGVLNIAAQHLYKQLQYQYLSTIPGYYNGKEDAFRMARLVQLH